MNMLRLKGANYRRSQISCNNRLQKLENKNKNMNKKIKEQLNKEKNSKNKCKKKINNFKTKLKTKPAN